MNTGQLVEPSYLELMCYVVTEPNKEITTNGEHKEEESWVNHVRAIDVVLGGETTIALHQQFLIRNNNSDIQILKNTKVRGHSCKEAFGGAPY